jgi:hypothetical protein
VRQYVECEALAEYPKRWHLGSRRDEIVPVKHGEEVVGAAQTFPFAPARKKLRMNYYTPSTRNRLLVRRLFDPLVPAGPRPM